MIGTAFIYALCCPFDGTVRYIGKSNDPERRFEDHLNESKHYNFKKCAWIKHLTKQGKQPVLEVLKECTEDNWQAWEKVYIKKFQSPYLMNGTSGGEGGLTSTSFKKGHKLSEESKEKIRQAHLGKKLSREQIEKMARKSRKSVIIEFIDGEVKNFNSVGETVKYYGVYKDYITDRKREGKTIVLGGKVAKKVTYGR